MEVLALDPGNLRSALVALRGPHVLFTRHEENAALKDWLTCQHREGATAGRVLVIEQVASMGMAVGEEVFETVFWSGRFAEAWAGEFARVPRREVKLALCHHQRATDSNIRTALLDIYGPGKDLAVGTKKNPGPLFGFRADLWAALALGLTYQTLKGIDVTSGRHQIREEAARARTRG